MAQEASKRMGIPFGIIDLSLAPTPSVGDSVAAVSYTHLDVYKRQGQRGAGAIQMEIQNGHDSS